MRSATFGTTTPRELWDPSVPGVLEKLEGHMTDVLAMLKEVKIAVSTAHMVDQCSARKEVEDLADELREMSESRATAWQAENSAAEAWMAELKEFQESRVSSSCAESMLTNREVEALTEERTQAGSVFPNIFKVEHWLSMRWETSGVRQGAGEPEGTHLATTVTGADTDKQTNKLTNMELDGTRLAAMEEAKQMLKQHTESLKVLEEKADEYDMELKSQREALDKMDATIWDGLQDAGDESDSLRARLEQVESQVTQLPERIKGEIRAEAPDATSVDEKGMAVAKQLDEKVLAFSRQLAEAAKQLKAREEECDFLRAVGSRLQARTGQLEARLDTEIEQLKDEHAGLEEAGSMMRTVESRCMEMLKVHQRRMDAEFVRLQEINTKASQKFDQLLDMLQGT